MFCVHAFGHAYILSPSFMHKQIYHPHTTVYSLFVLEVICSRDRKSIPSLYCMCCRVLHSVDHPWLIYPAPFCGRIGGLQASEGVTLNSSHFACVLICALDIVLQVELGLKDLCIWYLKKIKTAKLASIKLVPLELPLPNMWESVWLFHMPCTQWAFLYTFIEI